MKLGIEKWIVRTDQVMYSNAISKVTGGLEYSDEFGVQVGVHQGSVLNPLLFIIIFQDITDEFKTGCPQELLYADDFAFTAVIEAELEKFQV